MDAECDHHTGDVDSPWSRPPSSPGVLNTQTDNCQLFARRPIRAWRMYRLDGRLPSQVRSTEVHVDDFVYFSKSRVVRGKWVT